MRETPSYAHTNVEHPNLTVTRLRQEIAILNTHCANQQATIAQQSKHIQELKATIRILASMIDNPDQEPHQ